MEQDTGVPCFMKLPKIPISGNVELTVRKCQLFVDNVFKVVSINSFTVVFDGIWNSRVRKPS